MEQNTLGYWMWFLLIGGIIGWMAGLITRGHGFGVIGDIAVGIVGSMLGGWMASILGLYPVSSMGALMVALAGAIVLVGLTRLIVRQTETA
jgi:uncharacterized membrane protein YeaQ/YmgE (transglycosylase-associated protein family)